MKKLLNTSLLMGFMLLLSQWSFAQQDKKEQISKALNDYFALERENIHVHFDKNVFLTTENIWFKGYVYHRKKNVPFFSCINIFASLINEEGAIVETKLLYGSLGNFSGSFKLNETFKSGKYYIQFYTNWMNNFTEDESSVYDVTIINPASGDIPPLNTEALPEINISLNPEGGAMVHGVNNIVGISVTGCDGNPIAANEAVILNSAGETIKKIPLNKLGYGRFDILAEDLTGYKVAVTVNGKTQEQQLPEIQVNGIALKVNNYALAGKTILKLRTNSTTLASFNSKPLYVVIQKDEKANILEMSFDSNNTELSVLLPDTDFFEGINTIRVLDSNLKQIAERLIYNFPKTVLNSQLSKISDDNGTVEFAGKINSPNMNLSISVLPGATISLDETEDIYGALLISPYIDSHQKTAAKAYFSNISRSSKYELDLYLLNQKSKYLWNNILSGPPKSNYTFDIGLALKGTINQDIRSKEDYKVRIASLAGMIDEKVNINEKNEFFLNNLILSDSARLSFSLIKDGTKIQDLKLYPQVFNFDRKFNKRFRPSKTSCSYSESTVANEGFELPKFTTKTITLDEIEITGKTTELKHEKRFGNSQLRGYKITEAESKNFFYLLDLIRYHGFDVKYGGMNGVSITGRTVNTINGQPTRPVVWMDNMQMISFNMLQGIQTADVDELYINQHAVVPGVDNRMGKIKIYMKTDFSHRMKDNPATTFIVKNGFEKIEPFKNSEYINTYDDTGFRNFGLIDWQPVITTDEKGEFKFSIPKLYFGQVKVLIEGLGPDGKMISEIKTITL